MSPTAPAPGPDGTYQVALSDLVRRVHVVALAVGLPALVVMFLILGPRDPMVRWGYPPIAVLLVTYAWVLLRRPARAVTFSRATLVALEAVWVAGIAVRVRTAEDVDATWLSLFPTYFMVVVLFLVLGFLFFGPRGALTNAAGLTVGVVGAGVVALLVTDGGEPYALPVVRFGVALAVLAVFLHVLARAQGRLALAMLAAQRAAEEALQMRDMAYLDALTGIANRRRLVEELSHQSTRTGPAHPVAVVYFDLDRFKQVNDRLGHAVGDEVLCRVATLAASLVRRDDVVGRLGGEEFVVVAPGSSYESGLRLAERLRAALPAEVGGDLGVSVTASFGVTMLQPGETASSVLDRVDGLMYEAKAAGRDRVTGAAG